MRLIWKIFVIACGVVVSVNAQVALQPGDVFTYTFTNLPQVVPGPGFSEVPTGGFTLSVSSFDSSNDVLLVEMFENSTNEAPLLSFIQDTATDGSASSNAWADFQGTVRFTMMSGSVTIEQLMFFHDIPTGPGTWDRHQLLVVPTRAGSLLEQLVPCAGPVGGGTWRNHGQYVSTITRTARDLVRQGLMTQRERSQAVRQAAQSQCGKQGKKPKHPRH